MASRVETGTIPFEDVDYYASSFGPTWDLEFRQMDANLGSGGCQYGTDGRGLVYEERYPATIALKGKVGTGAVSFVLSDERGRRGRWFGAAHPEHGLAYADDRKELDVLLPRGTGNLAVVLPLADFRETFERLADREVGEVFPDDRMFKCLGPRARARLERSLRRLRQPHREPGCLVSEIVSALVEAGCPEAESSVPDWPRTRQLFRRAVESCEAAGKPVTSPGELALQLGVSLRSLQLAFQSCAGIAPGTFLRRQRLNTVHRELLHLDPAQSTVGGVAMEHGFRELGRFAGEYRKIFGETPSETLWRSPVRPGQMLPKVS